MSFKVLQFDLNRRSFLAFSLAGFTATALGTTPSYGFDAKAIEYVADAGMAITIFLFIGFGAPRTLGTPSQGSPRAGTEVCGPSRATSPRPP